MDSPKPANGTTRIKPGRRLSLRQALDFQKITHEAAQGLRDDFTVAEDPQERARVACAIANLGKSWVSLQDAKREILGRPKAGVLKPEKPNRRRRSATADLQQVAREMGLRAEQSAATEQD